jgi:hypothetical protein
MTTKVEPPKFERGELVRMMGLKDDLHIVLGPGPTEYFWRVHSLASGKRYGTPYYWMIRLKRKSEA